MYLLPYYGVADTSNHLVDVTFHLFLFIILATTSRIVGTRCISIWCLGTRLYLFGFCYYFVYGVKDGHIIMFSIGGFMFEEDGMYVLEYLYCLRFRVDTMTIYVWFCVALHTLAYRPIRLQCRVSVKWTGLAEFFF